MKSYCTTPGIGVSKMLKILRLSFYVMGKALSGELSCPCDRSCPFVPFRSAKYQNVPYELVFYGTERNQLFIPHLPAGRWCVHPYVCPSVGSVTSSNYQQFL